MTRTLGLGLVALLGVLVLQACGGEEAVESDAPGPAQETSLGDCREAVPDTALETLGWESWGVASLDSGTCTRAAAQGDIAVERWPVGAVGGDDLPAAAQQSFDEHCADLYGEPGEEVDWMGPDTQACGRVDGEGRGVSYLVALTEDDTIVEARVSAGESTSDDLVRDALVELVAAAAATF